jgi:DNA-binding transcriptional MerR regulator
VELVKIGELARRSQVPIPTLKFYLREGLIQPKRKTGRTMFWYESSLIGRIRTIKELQRQFLPLEVIRETLERDADSFDDLAAAQAIAGVFAKHTGRRSRTREEVLSRGATSAELDWLAQANLAVPSPEDQRYRGDDLALLATLGDVRRSGLGPDVLSLDVLGEYIAAIRTLVAIELRMFSAGVAERAKTRGVRRVTAMASELAERLVVLIRRKLLLPTLEEQATLEPPDAGRKAPSRRRAKRERSAPAARRKPSRAAGTT